MDSRNASCYPLSTLLCEILALLPLIIHTLAPLLQIIHASDQMQLCVAQYSKHVRQQYLKFWLAASSLHENAESTRLVIFTICSKQGTGHAGCK